MRLTIAFLLLLSPAFAANLEVPDAVAKACRQGCVVLTPEQVKEWEAQMELLRLQANPKWRCA